MPFKPGQSGNPAGRPRGARDKLSRAMYSEAVEHWDKHGPAALDKVFKDNPARYLQFMAQILPKFHDVSVDDFKHRPLVEYSMEELLAIQRPREEAA